MEMEDFLDNLNENEFDGKTCDAEERKCKTDDECVSVRYAYYYKIYIDLINLH